MPKQGKKLNYKIYPLINIKTLSITKGLDNINRSIIDQTMPTMVGNTCQQCWEIPWQQQYWETREIGATQSLNDIISLWCVDTVGMALYAS